MTGLSALQFISACCWLNGFRGRGLVPGGRILACLGVGVAFGLLAWGDDTSFGRSALLGGVTALGVYFWAVWPWGTGFMAVTGRDARTGTTSPRLTRLTEALCGTPPAPTPVQARHFGLVFMALRGLYLYPLFAALACLVTPWALPAGLGGALQGACYRLVGCFPESPRSVACAELLFGAVIGLLLALTLGLGS